MDVFQYRPQVEYGLIPILDHDIGHHVVKFNDEPPEAVRLWNDVIYVRWEHVPVDTSLPCRGYQVPCRVCLHTLLGRGFAFCCIGECDDGG